MAQGAGDVEGEGEQAAEPQQAARPGELGAGVAVQGQEPDAGQQAGDAEVDGGGDQPGDPRGDAQVQVQPGDVAEAERERQGDDGGGYL